MTFGQMTVSGKVIDSAGEALIGANVTAKGAEGTGTITDIDGMYSVRVPSGTNTLVFSYTGYETQEVAIGSSNVVNVTMAEGKVLEEIVVTALGIKREKKALGYATTSISAEEIAGRPETDVARALAGRSPGVTIANSAGLAGSGTKINIRGVSTISGNSQPLWVVDGVPINTGSEDTKDFRDGNIAPTRNLDIDPNNIETMSVLRGLSATTLYGSQGRNGVILITTKTGSVSKKKYYASVSQAYNIVEAVFPEYQNKWANGFDGVYGEFFSNWGYVMDGNAPVNGAGGLPYFRHPYFEHRALFPDRPEFQLDGTTLAKAYIPVAQPNNVADFFKMGQSLTTSANAGVSSEFGGFNISISKTGEDGYIKNNRLDRTNVSVGGTANLSSKLKLSGSLNYVKTDFKTPPVGAGLGSNSNGGPSVFANLLYTPRNIDLTNLPFANPVTKEPIYYRNGGDITNPYWLLDNAGETSKVDRFMTNLSASYKMLDWLTATYRVGVDNFTNTASYYSNKGARGFPVAVGAFGTGFLRNTVGRNTITDHTLYLTGVRSLSDDIDLTINVGANSRKDTYNQNGSESLGQIVFGLLNERNFLTTSARTIRGQNLNFERNQLLNGVYGDLNFGYKNYLYLNVSGRNDWSSTHQPEFNSIFYPGVSVSFVPSDAFEGIQGSFLDYLKLRAAYGTSANFAAPYSTTQSLLINTELTKDNLGQSVGLSNPDLLANTNLTPELQSELEFGIETKLYDNRFGVDLSIYSRLAKDQIVERPLDPSSGYFSTFINAGTISNKGIELALSINPIRSKNFNWDLRFNFTKNTSLVESLPEGSKEILIGGFTNLGSFAIEGQPFGVIKGTRVEKNEKGELLVTENGDWKISSETHIIGDPNPDWMLSGFTNFNIFGVNLGAQVDFVRGGEIFSYSAAVPIGRGVAKELESFDPTLTVILPGVKEDGTPNDIPMPASGVFFGNNIIGGGADDRGIYEATRIRIREISAGYALPSRLFKNSIIKGVNIQLTANNVWWRTFNTPASAKVDPDRTTFGQGNGTGFDFLGGPSARRMGINVKVDF